MKIKTEAELVSELATNLKLTFRTDIAVKEFSAGYGIADLVFAKDYSSKNAVDREPINNYYAVKLLLSKFETGLFTKEDIRQLCGVSNETTRNIINLLTADGYIEKTNANYFRVLKLIDNPIKKIVAIEAKLRDWKSGILQARRYKSFTDECYLAILSDYEKNIDQEMLDRFGIGLIIFNQVSGEIEVKKKPTQDEYLSFYKDEMGLFAKEHFLFRAQKLELV